ncbi:MAG: orotate phosphoribosyltransferase [Bacteroidales bacterium]|nr:orotate phosphoribosyltransferase [Bacteroidales bacterium]
MSLYEESALTVAGLLLQIKAIKLNVASPYTWASGIKSPIYCDNRITLSFPKIRTYLRQEFARIIEEKYEKPDLIVGVATGGIAHGVLVAQELGLPFAYVRTEKKSHGLTNQIEGHVESGQTVIIIEDLVSTGGSSLSAVTALRDAGLKVKAMLAIFTYGLDVAKDNFAKENVELFTLTNYETLLSKAIEDKYVTEKDLQSLISWRMNPHAWKQS